MNVLFNTPLLLTSCTFPLTLRCKTPNEIGNHRQISPHVTNYRIELRLFTHEVGMLIIVEIADHIVVFPQKNDVISDVNYLNFQLRVLNLKIISKKLVYVQHYL